MTCVGQKSVTVRVSPKSKLKTNALHQKKKMDRVVFDSYIFASSFVDNLPHWKYNNKVVKKY